jgi:hypothetical protein
MAKVIFKKLKTTGSHSVGKKRVPGANGRSKTVHTLDANSATFDADLRYVFGRSVAKARRDNRQIVRSAGSAPRKR